MIYRMEKLRLRFQNLVGERPKTPHRPQLSAYETQSVRLRTDGFSRSGVGKSDAHLQCIHLSIPFVIQIANRLDV